MSSNAAEPLQAPQSQGKTGFVRLAGDLKFRQSYDYKQDSEIDPAQAVSRGTATALEYRAKVARTEQKPQEVYEDLHGYSWSSLKVRVCNDDPEETGEATMTIDAWPWALELSDGSVTTPVDDKLSGFPHPLYPTDEEDLHSGSCRTGNIMFVVPDDQHVTRVLYMREGSLPVAWTDQ
ncbi:hypothetical protein [Streptomyces sp. NPDC058108]|uniref:hypothetical protein n=1 Tax=Streptomyces sp. NPDC058108 TaxID=3346344 RepID=UPI0036E929ED